MTKNIFVIISLSLLLLTSCKKEDIEFSPTNYLIFGHFYGECIGESCIEIFRLEEDKLFEKTDDKLTDFNNAKKGKWVQLTNQQFVMTKDLIDFFPKELLQETNSRIGEPDAGDWGGLVIGYNFNGIQKTWSIDQIKSNVPAAYHFFIDKVNEKIKDLQ